MKVITFSVALLVAFIGVNAKELLADDTEYKNLLGFDQFLQEVKAGADKILGEKGSHDHDSLTLQYANIAMMYYQRNERWKQGGTRESLEYITLALEAQNNPKDNAHNDHRLKRAMILHQGQMLTSLGWREKARQTYDSLLATIEDSFERSTGASAPLKAELAKVLFHKGELLYTLYDEYNAAIALFEESLHLNPCNHEIHQHIVHALKASKNTTQAQWQARILSMDEYLLKVHQRKAHNLNRQHQFKYNSPLIDFREPNLSYDTGRSVQAAQSLSVANPISWVSYLYALGLDWYSYLLVPRDSVVCTFSHATVSAQSDAYADFGTVRTSTTMATIQAAVHWALFEAADALDPVVPDDAVVKAVQCPAPAPTTATTTTSTATSSITSTDIAWSYLQRARHFERLRLNEQHERIAYKEAQEQQDAGIGDSLDPVALAKAQLPYGTSGAGDDDGDGGGGEGRGRRLSKGERVDQRECQRSAAQAKHVQTFFEKGYWGNGENVYGEDFDPSAVVKRQRKCTKSNARKGKAHAARDGSDVGGSDGDGGVCTRDHHVGQRGSKTRIPIFIVGFFRSGSTLLERLLVQHGAVKEPTLHLRDGNFSYAAQEEGVVEKLGFERRAIWGMGEDSPFVFEMYAMQEETLALYAGLEEHKASIKQSQATSPSKQQKLQQQTEDQLEQEFMRQYREIVDRRAHSIVGKMQSRYRDVTFPAQCSGDDSGGNGGDGGDDSKGTSTCHSGNTSTENPIFPTHVVDKMLTNYINIGLIHMVFPRAIILHTVRDPLDTLFSCYSTRFGDVNAAFTLYLPSLVQRYAHYLEVVQHFRTVLPTYEMPVWPVVLERTSKIGTDAAIVDSVEPATTSATTTATTTATTSETDSSTTTTTTAQSDTSTHPSPDRTTATSAAAAARAKPKALRTQALVDIRYEELVTNPERVLRFVLEDLLGLYYNASPSNTTTTTITTTTSVSRSRGQKASGDGVAGVAGVADGEQQGVVGQDGTVQKDVLHAEQRNTRPQDKVVDVVKTASRLQIKAPIYAQSVGRWRKYAAQLNTTLIPALREQLPNLAARGALLYLDPHGPLAQAAKSLNKGKKTSNSSGAKSGSCAKKTTDKTGKKRPECVYANWALDPAFDYAGMLAALR